MLMMAMTASNWHYFGAVAQAVLAPCAKLGIGS